MKTMIFTAIVGLISASLSYAQESVDLGLSVKWATFNVGADAPEAGGNFFAWGEIQPKANYDDATYADSRYANPPEIASTSLDAATQSWGEEWRMPTAQELQELLKCQWEWISIKEATGYKITGKNGNSIFLPAAGAMEGETLVGKNLQGYYASSQEGNSNPAYCYFLYLQLGKQDLRAFDKSRGWSIRPVLNDKAGRRALARQMEENELTPEQKQRIANFHPRSTPIRRIESPLPTTINTNANKASTTNK